MVVELPVVVPTEPVLVEPVEPLVDADVVPPAEVPPSVEIPVELVVEPVPAVVVVPLEPVEESVVVPSVVPLEPVVPVEESVVEPSVVESVVPSVVPVLVVDVVEVVEEPEEPPVKPVAEEAVDPEPVPLPDSLIETPAPPQLIITARARTTATIPTTLFLMGHQITFDKGLYHCGSENVEKYRRPT